MMEKEVHKALSIMDADTGKNLNYRQLIQSNKHKQAWTKSSANKFGQLANGLGGRIKGNNTIKFIHKQDIPPECRKYVTYGQFVCSIRLEKTKPTVPIPARWR